ncbi:MAG: LPS-assembly protein LptD [Bacteroidales bacterium]|nr:LPS-assembly protein LptD [Bacteroidales bacterium]
MMLKAGAQTDTSYLHVPDSLVIINDTIIANDSSLKKDTLKPDSIAKTDMGISPNAVKSIVTYKADDSIRLDLTRQKVFMFKNNDIQYQDINLKADYVEIEFYSNTVFAKGTEDSVGNPVGRPVFTMADNSFESEEMKYNYETKKGLVKKVITEDAEGYLHGSTVKKMPDDITNILHGSYTTCELEHPHFEFRFKKAKVIPDNKIVTGPAYLVIEDVATPFAIPFGLFPNKKGQRSGIVIPTYGESNSRGFYLENGGYYWAINDYLDLKIVGDIYTLGSWAVKPAMNYRKRYKFNGYLNGNYAINYIGEEGTDEFVQKRDYSLRWVHTQDPKARPNSKFSANVNIQSSDYSKFNPATTTAYLSNTFQSSVTYSRDWAGKYHLNTSLKHSQNTITRQMTLNLPSLSFSVNRFYPFRAKKISGKLKWYENIAVNYSMAADNRLDTYDSLLFSGNIGKDLKNGLKHNVSVSSGSIKLLKHLVWSNTFNYTERWYTQKHVKSWQSDSLYFNEGSVGGSVGTDTIYGFNTVRDFNIGTSLSTKVYGMFAYKKGPVKAIRHVLTPSLSFRYTPDFSTQEWGYYRYYINDNGETVKYSPYDGFIYGTAPSGKSGNIGFSLSNNLEMKVRARKDTVTGTKKVVLIENLSLSTGYDLAKDSLNFNKVSINGRTTLFKKLQVNFTSSYDPYVLDSNGRRINKFEWEVNRKILRPENYNWSFSLSFDLNSDLLQKERKSDAGTEQELEDLNQNLDSYVDWNVPWTVRVNYTMQYNTILRYENGYWNYAVSRDKNIIQTLQFSGDVNITPKWKFGFNANYDFENKAFAHTSLDIYRDLHCWEMRFTWIPVSTYQQQWNFTINIKSSLLQDLKLDKKRDFRDY